MKSKLLILLSLTSTFLYTSSCKKFLEAKSDQKLAVPMSLIDFQALLDRIGTVATEPNAGEQSSDDYYLEEADWESLPTNGDKRMYIWDPDYLFEGEINDWSTFSGAIYICNSVIEGLEKNYGKISDNEERNNIQGQACYFRAKQLLQASFIWCTVYDSTNATTTLGLPLRLDTDFNKRSYRATLQQTFEHIIADLNYAINYLPNDVSTVMRPSRPAAFGLMARCYLYMGNYQKALIYADSCLEIRHNILDFNTVDATLRLPLLGYNPEIISHSGMGAKQALNLTRGKVDSSLYITYKNDDLRKIVYFTNNTDGSHNFKGRTILDGTSLFSGISTSEVRFIRMECLTRLGIFQVALNELNAFLESRWKRENGISLFFPYLAIDEESVLNILLNERRKELLFRGLRWPDIKRLNREGFQTGLKRKLGDKTYSLPPNDLRFALPIPENVILISGMQQNPRQ